MSIIRPSPPPDSGPRRHFVAVVLALVVVAILVTGLVAGYVFLFGAEAPDAPTLDKAIEVLRASASPR